MAFWLWLIFLTQSIHRSSTIIFITPTLLTGEIDALLICTNFKMCRKNIRLKNSNERIWYFLAKRPTYFQKSITHPVEFFSLKGSPSVCDFSFGIIDLNIDNLFCSGYSVISIHPQCLEIQCCLSFKKFSITYTQQDSFHLPREVSFWSSS